VESHDHPLEPAAVRFLTADHPPASLNLVVLAPGFIPHHGRLILGNPAVDLRAILAEHMNEVFGLASVSSVTGPGSGTILIPTHYGSMHRHNLTEAVSLCSETLDSWQPAGRWKCLCRQLFTGVDILPA
jgi:hypothetical protein